MGDFEVVKAIRTLHRVGFEGVSTDDLECFIKQAQKSLIRKRKDEALSDISLLLLMEKFRYEVKLNAIDLQIRGRIVGKYISIVKPPPEKEAQAHKEVLEAFLDRIQRERSISEAINDPVFIHYMKKGSWKAAQHLLQVLTKKSPDSLRQAFLKAKEDFCKNKEILSNAEDFKSFFGREPKNLQELERFSNHAKEYSNG